ncbi:uncharacterized protein LOC107727771 [Sinocyclocheilus rhinocerous]|uniref:uncharacterized protein LOC107727771 n=1 Tax=Sinocyclocheilus rhinocerous TaxID=307959 RepID=UPI0007B8D25E|nr:PREDICTED: uncharacterized protein LOC107727771 [Sinocyclocheilus rhinocerous]
MWIIHPLLIITLCMFLFNVLADNNKNAANPACEYLHPLMYAIICFLAAVILILLIILFKMFISMQSAIKRDTIHTTSDTRESTALCQNNALSVSPTSGADNSSSTSSGTPEGSLSDLSTSSQRYVSLEDRRKTSDYINVSETASLGLVDFKKMDTDYVNVKESQQKKVKRKGQVSCDDGTTSLSSDDSALNYSKVVFTKAEK